MEALAVLLRDAGAGGGGYNLELLKERQKASWNGQLYCVQRKGQPL